jgi:hypothetical protein
MTRALVMAGSGFYIIIIVEIGRPISNEETTSGRTRRSY